MKINVYSIEKSQNNQIKDLNNKYIKMSSKFAQINDIMLFNNKIAKAQTIGRDEARRAYSDTYNPFLKGFSVSLDEKGEMLTSKSFSKIFENHTLINFFIGGAYGLEENFIAKTQLTIGLSKLTFAHKIAKVVLFEQIYRGLHIKENHPYHK